jgi:hypothetical protein
MTGRSWKLVLGTVAAAATAACTVPQQQQSANSQSTPDNAVNAVTNNGTE